jgi:large subunit ribosomal protein L5
MQPELLTLYKEKLIAQLRQQLNFKNVHEVPRLEKIVVNCSIGSQADRKQAMEAVRDVGLITGQKAVSMLSKKAISNFKLRIGEPVGLKVTLRGNRMYDFLLRLVKTALPRVRDFRGVSSRAFDGRGNYTLGISDHSIFPEIELDKIKRALGFDITFVTTTQSDEHARELLRGLGMPFRGKAAAQAKDEAPAEAEAEAEAA